jgi:A/G-specific adenine glycosylase
LCEQSTPKLTQKPQIEVLPAMDEASAESFLPSATERRAFARRLLAWFRRAARDLPWRETNDLYAIWISEVMLQQTQVATVIPYYQRFLHQFPDVRTLAAADEQAVLRLWEGLGYYRRARQLHAAARQIVALHGGDFPSEFAAVRSLPGIGRYTAGAILSIGTGARLPILEANTIRVLSRLAAMRSDPASSSGQKQLWSLAEAILPSREVGHFNQALMELGSEVCTPKSPVCDRCPVRMHCRAFAAGAQHEIPLPAKKTKYEDVAETAVVVRRSRQVLVRQCQPGERWAGLWDFPRFAANGDVPTGVLVQTGVAIERAEKLTTIKHGVTRFRITLEVFEAQATRARRHTSNGKGDLRWVLVEELAALPLSVTGRKIARLFSEKLPLIRRTAPSAAVRRAGIRRKRG